MYVWSPCFAFFDDECVAGHSSGMRASRADPQANRALPRGFLRASRSTAMWQWNSSKLEMPTHERQRDHGHRIPTCSRHMFVSFVISCDEHKDFLTIVSFRKCRCWEKITSPAVAATFSSSTKWRTRVPTFRYSTRPIASCSQILAHGVLRSLHKSLASILQLPSSTCRSEKLVLFRPICCWAGLPYTLPR